MRPACTTRLPPSPPLTPSALSLPSTFSPEAASPLEGAPRAPRFLLPPIDGPCAALGTVRSNLQIHPDAWGPRSRWGWGTVRGDRVCAGSAITSQPPKERSFCYKTSYLESLSPYLPWGEGCDLKDQPSIFSLGIFPKWTPGRFGGSHPMSLVAPLSSTAPPP